MVASRNRPLLLGLLLLLACAAVFGETGRHGFVRWDDEINVYQNPVTPAHLAHFWLGTGMGQGADTVYRPVVYTAYALIARVARTAPYTTDSQMATLDARPFHAANLLLHALNVLLVFGLLRRLIRQDWAAGAGALLFAVHPLQVESVAWVTGLTDLLGAFFSLLALGEHIRFRESGRRYHRALAALWFVLALGSNPSAVTLPLVALAVDHWLLGRVWRDGSEALAWWVPLAGAAVLITRHAEPVTALAVTVPWAARPLIAGDALAVGLAHLVWPASLALDYGRSPHAVLGGGWAWLTGLVPLVLAALVRRSHRPWLKAAAAVYVLALLPSLGLIPFRFQAYSTVADRYSYFALLGPALALAGTLAFLPRRLPARPRLALGTACAGGFLLLGLTSALQVTFWQNSFALFGHAVEVNPRSWVSHFDLGSLLADSGHAGEAAGEYRRVLGLKSAYAPAFAAEAQQCLATELDRAKELDQERKRQTASQEDLDHASDHAFWVPRRPGAAVSVPSAARARRAEPESPSGHDALRADGRPAARPAGL